MGKVKIPYDLYEGRVTLRELERLLKELAGYHKHKVQFGSGVRGVRWTHRVEIGKTDEHGYWVPVETYHGSTRQEATIRARIHLVALLKHQTLQTYGHGSAGLVRLRMLMGLSPLEGVSVEFLHEVHKPNAPKDGRAPRARKEVARSATKHPSTSPAARSKLHRNRAG